MKKDLVTVKIERKVYKKLQQLKLDTEAKTISDVIGYAQSDRLIASEALFGFAGWITTRDEEVIASAKHDAAVWANLVDTFIRENNLENPRNCWENNLIHPSGGCSHNNKG